MRCLLRAPEFEIAPMTEAFLAGVGAGTMVVTTITIPEEEGAGTAFAVAAALDKSGGTTSVVVVSIVGVDSTETTLESTGVTAGVVSTTTDEVVTATADVVSATTGAEVVATTVAKGVAVVCGTWTMVEVATAGLEATAAAFTATSTPS